MMATFGAAAAVVLSMNYLSSASALQEDLQSLARYVAQHAQSGDVIALPDHAITAAVDYYLASDKRHIPLWPQLGTRQPYVEGFDLSLHPPSTGGFPRRVWLVEDGSVPGVTRFEGSLYHYGYVPTEIKQFNGSRLLLFSFALPATALVVPTSGATLSGTTAALAAAASSYGFGITKVQFVLSGGSYSQSVIGTAIATLAGYIFFWNTTSVPDGTYRLQTLATSGAYKTNYSHAITVKVEN
jgi:Bacterial Ig domain